MATNAAKYGAFSTENGVVTVEWSVEDGQLAFDWKETGGPPLATELGSPGFGTSLVTNTITRHGGTISNDWHHDGVRIRITPPLKSLAH